MENEISKLAEDNLGNSNFKRLEDSLITVEKLSMRNEL